MDKALQERQQNLSYQQERLNKQQFQLEQQCATPEAKSYISLTAARILQKDMGNVTKVQNMEISLKNLQSRLGDVLTMHAAVKAELLIEQPLKLHKENTGGTSARRRMEDEARSLSNPHYSAGGGLSASLYQLGNHDLASMDETEREAQSEINL